MMPKANNVQPKEDDKLLVFTEEQKALMRRTVAKGIPEDDFSVLIYMAEKYGLDPFAKEIWAFKPGEDKPTVIMTSRDGYLTIAQRHPEYSGPPLSFVVCEGDEFAVDAATYQVTHRFGATRGKILGAWAKIDRVGKTPAIGYVPFIEYKQDTKKQWQHNPSAMIQKVAEAFVLKRQFGISGLVTREEIDEDGNSTPPRSLTVASTANGHAQTAAKAATGAEPPSFVTGGEPQNATAAPAKPNAAEPPRFMAADAAEATSAPVETPPAVADAQSATAPALQPQVFVLTTDPKIVNGRTGPGAKMKAKDESGAEVSLFATGEALLEKIKAFGAGQKIIAVGTPVPKGGLMLSEVKEDAA